ncbi:MAG: MFS transporter [Clostridia bacterium]|nr:MFS transporter [Clostridia bacterium]
MGNKGFGEKIKGVLGIEGKTSDVLRPMLGYDCANITLGGAGYPLNLYHQQFLTFVEKVSVEAAGMIGMISGIVDAVTDVAMGIITDRTKSKYGKHRRYLLWGILPFVIAYITKWSSFGISSLGRPSLTFIYYLFSSLLYSTGYTMMSIPHTAMLPTVAPKYFERTQYKIIEYAFNSVGQIASFAFMGMMLGGTNMDNPSPDDRTKYMLCGIVLALWFCWSPIVCFFKTKEESSLEMENEPFDFRYLVNEYVQVFRNKAFREYFFINLFYGFAKSFYSYSDQYFIISIAERYSVFNILNVIAGVAEFSGAPFNYLLIRYKGKRLSGLTLAPLMMTGLLMNAFVSPTTPTFIIYLAAILYNFGFSGPGFVINNIQPDITDVDELITGRRREGVISTFNSFVKKTINSFVSGLMGFSLKFFGYDTSKQAYALQTARSVFGLKLNFCYLPAVFTAISLFFIIRYTMTKKDHETIKQAIAEKRQTGSCNLDEKEKKRIERIAGQRWEDMWIGKPEHQRSLESVQ